MKRTDLAWAAGFIDGDGCITITKNGNAHTLRVQVDSTTRKPLEKLVSDLGGKINGPYMSRSKHKDSYNRRPISTWVLNGVAAKEILGKLLPYLVNKKSQAAIGISLQTWGRTGRGHAATSEFVAAQVAIAQQLREEKRK